ncbi:hypothetical protein BDV33DRAFT_199424 [Aspergillus novoparasiticus]|uniref:Methyltransferase type 11 domain-containing protein n=1 Tax=Aspergillus novoparasiticus TaxID=986946 RepID=A0A5N6F4I5_9EURO|nr:hypothetical protein BDV33DRAFT_199424 [Aspergillus novoparasiticus]
MARWRFTESSRGYKNWQESPRYGMYDSRRYPKNRWGDKSDHVQPDDLVEGAGFNWVKGEVQLRQTTLTEHEKGGVEGWIRLFGEPFLELLPTTEARDAAVKHAVDVLEAVGRHQHDGSFTVNYIRLRFVAQKPE